MTKEIFLSGMTADQLSEMIRESLRDELRQLHPEPSAKTPNYLTRRETARRLRISLVTLNDWVNRGRIRAHKIGGGGVFPPSGGGTIIKQPSDDNVTVVGRIVFSK